MVIELLKYSEGKGMIITMESLKRELSLVVGVVSGEVGHNILILAILRVPLVSLFIYLSIYLFIYLF